METNGLLESYLKQLRLPTFLQNYAKFAEDAIQNNLDFQRYLLALAEQEVLQREQNRRKNRIKAACTSCGAAAGFAKFTSESNLECGTTMRGRSIV